MFEDDTLSETMEAVEPGVPEGCADGQLLDRYILARDPAAFEALVARHGPMVMGVCRRVLGNTHDAEDAFQATFVVLMRKADTIVNRHTLGSWLQGVAQRVSLNVRTRTSQHKAHEAKHGALLPQADATIPEHSAQHADVKLVIDEELGRLPEKYRAPVVLCYLEGKTNAEAAGMLSWPIGTVQIRLSRARDMLRQRLNRRGLVLTSAALTALLVEEGARAAVPAALVASTAGLGQTVSASAVAPAISTAAQLTMKQMALAANFKIFTAAVAVTAITVGGAAMLPVSYTAPGAVGYLRVHNAAYSDLEGSQDIPLVKDGLRSRISKQTTFSTPGGPRTRPELAPGSYLLEVDVTPVGSKDFNDAYFLVEPAPDGSVKISYFSTDPTWAQYAKNHNAYDYTFDLLGPNKEVLKADLRFGESVEVAGRKPN
ncbi:MAG: RNA polymerase sigma factor [Gemmataceae bacterium]